VKLFFLIAAVIFAADRLTKMLVLDLMTQGQSIAVIPGVFHITYILNKGMAFGLMPGGLLLFVIVTFAAIGLIVYQVVHIRSRSVLMYSSLGLVLGGALGNLVDRIRIGCVIDFLDFRIWPVFNLADSSITIGACILALRIITSKHRER